MERVVQYLPHGAQLSTRARRNPITEMHRRNATYEPPDRKRRSAAYAPEHPRTEHATPRNATAEQHRTSLGALEWVIEGSSRCQDARIRQIEARLTVT